MNNLNFRQIKDQRSMVTHCFHDEIFIAQVEISPCELNYLRSLVMPLINLFNSISCRTLFSGLFLLWVMLGMIMGNHAFSALTEADRIQKCCRKSQVRCRLVWGWPAESLLPWYSLYIRYGPDRMRTLEDRTLTKGGGGRGMKGGW